MEPAPTELKLPTDISNKTLNDIIKKELNTDQYTVNICEGSNKGDNYIGIIYRVKATATNQQQQTTNGNNNSVHANDNRNQHNGNNKNDISIIVKLPPMNDARREQFFVRPCFLRESLMYDEIIPLFQKFQRTKGICDKDGFFEVPKCYQTITSDKEEALFLEDLSTSKFTMFSRHVNATFDHARLIMEILGKLHAFTYAFKDQDFDKIEQYQHLVDIFTSRDNDENFNEWMENMGKRAFDTLDEETDKIVLEKFRKFMEKPFMERLKNASCGKLAEPYSVISHGDCWNNNILYKNDKDGKPIEARLLDWQISRYSSPVCDLVYYIFGCTTKELRDQYYDELIGIYHKTLSDFLIRLGSDPEKLFPFSALQSQLKQFGKFGLIMSMIVIPIFTSHADDVPDLDDMAEKLQNGDNMKDMNFNSEKTQDLYKKRMSDVVKDMVRLGYI